MSLETMLERANDLEQVIKQYVAGELKRGEFSERYPALLKGYEESIAASAYYPMDILVATEDNSERAWKENMIAMYKQEISNLEALLKDDEPSYSEKLSEKKLLQHCKETLTVLPRQRQDHLSKKWIEDNLVDDVYFAFLKNDKTSKFGSHIELYRAKIERESFLLSALTGQLPKPKFQYPELLTSLSSLTKTKVATWARCSEPDGALAAIETNSSLDGSAYVDVEAIGWIEHTSGQDVQWADCHLLLLPEDYSWMLKISNNFQELKIELHGDGKFIGSILKKLRIDD